MARGPGKSRPVLSSHQQLTELLLGSITPSSKASRPFPAPLADKWQREMGMDSRVRAAT
jgi:hypothetical protein